VRDVTRCPKCGSQRIAFAHDEAPAWATQWTKCFACGKRWNLNGGPPTGRSEDDEESERTSVTPQKRTGDDLVKLVMDVSRQRNPGPRVEPSERKEQTMAKCTKGSCQDDAADDSVLCPKHRDQKARSNAKYQGRMQPDSGRVKRKYTRRTPLGGGGYGVESAGETLTGAGHVG